MDLVHLGIYNDPQCSTDIHHRYHQLLKAIVSPPVTCRGRSTPCVHGFSTLLLKQKLTLHNNWPPYVLPKSLQSIYWACWLGPNWACWLGPIGTRSVHGKQARNTIPVLPTDPHDIQSGAKLGLFPGGGAIWAHSRVYTRKTAQKHKLSLAHVSTSYPKWGPIGIVGWGPIGAHSIPSKQPRNPSPV